MNNAGIGKEKRVKALENAVNRLRHATIARVTESVKALQVTVFARRNARRATSGRRPSVKPHCTAWSNSYSES